VRPSSLLTSWLAPKDKKKSQPEARDAVLILRVPGTGTASLPLRCELSHSVNCLRTFASFEAAVLLSLTRAITAR